MPTPVTKWYGAAAKHLVQGDILWDANTVKLALTTSAYTPSQDSHEYFSDVTNELSASGNYTAGGNSIAGKAHSYDSATNEERLTASNLTFTALTPSSAFRYGIIYKSTGTAATSPLIAYIDFIVDQNPGGGDFLISWPVTGVVYLAAA